MPEPEIISLAETSLFRGLAREAAVEILKLSTLRSLAAGEQLFLQGEPVTAMFIVESGLLRLVQHTQSGEEVIVRTMGRGEIVAGVALLGERRYPVSAIGHVDGQVRWWARVRILEIAERYPALRTNVLGTIADRMQDSLSRIRELSTENVAQRVARALVRLATEHGRKQAEGVLIDQPLGRQGLADLAGASMFTASRLLAGWARDGILEVGRERVLVRSIERLEALANGSGDTDPLSN
ncbi:MAG: Crp/Fnr family transcriptional regulator [Thermoanaerobaculia bacterium]